VENVARVEASVKEVNSKATIVRARSVITVEGEDGLRGKHVLVVEDGPTLTHGEMATGAGAEAARLYGAAELVDPRPYAVGEIAQVFQKYGHLGPILPAVGYYPAQLKDLAATIEAVPADLVVSATPFDIASVIEVSKPVVRVSYELEDLGGELTALVCSFLKQRGLGRLCPPRTADPAE
jgi:predicted GTPase